MGPPTDSVELAGLCAPTLPSYQQPTVSQSPLFVIRENQGRRRRAQDRAMSDSKHTLESKPHPRRAPQSGSTVAAARMSHFAPCTLEFGVAQDEVPQPLLSACSCHEGQARGNTTAGELPRPPESWSSGESPTRQRIYRLSSGRGTS